MTLPEQNVSACLRMEQNQWLARKQNFKAVVPKMKWTRCCIYREPLVAKRLTEHLQKILLIINYFKSRRQLHRTSFKLLERFRET